MEVEIKSFVVGVHILKYFKFENNCIFWGKSTPLISKMASVFVLL